MLDVARLAIKQGERFFDRVAALQEKRFSSTQYGKEVARIPLLCSAEFALLSAGRWRFFLFAHRKTSKRKKLPKQVMRKLLWKQTPVDVSEATWTGSAVRDAARIHLHR